MTRIQNDKMLNNVINSVTAAVDQEKTVGGRFSRRRYGTVTKRQDIKEETAMNIIAAVDKHWAIGNRGKLLVTIPDDQKLFREETSHRHGKKDTGKSSGRTAIGRTKKCGPHER